MYVSEILKKEDIMWRKWEKGPKHHGDQLQQAKQRCGILRRYFFQLSGTTSIVLDDESYFSLQNDCCPGNDGYYVYKNTPLNDVPAHICIQPQEKYPVKVMVWVSISECGISAPYFCP